MAPKITNLPALDGAPPAPTATPAPAATDFVEGLPAVVETDGDIVTSEGLPIDPDSVTPAN